MADVSLLVQSSINAYLSGRPDLAREGLEEALLRDPSNDRARGILNLLESVRRTSAAFEAAPQLPLAPPVEEAAKGPASLRPKRGSPRVARVALRLAGRAWSRVAGRAASWEVRSRCGRLLERAAGAAPRLVIALALTLSGWAALRDHARIGRQLESWSGAGRAWISQSLTAPPRPIPSVANTGRPPAIVGAAVPSPRARIVIEAPPPPPPPATATQRIASARTARSPATAGARPARAAPVEPVRGATPPLATALGGDEWKPPRWGIGVDEATRSLTPGITRLALEPIPSDGGLTIRASAERIRIRSGTYAASYLFNSAGALTAVQLRPSDQRRSAESVFDELSAWLSSSYGQPTEDRELLPGEATVRRVTWFAPETRVTLEARRSGDVRGAHILLLDVSSGSLRAADPNTVVVTYSRLPTP